jgi:hypothetical protein
MADFPGESNSSANTAQGLQGPVSSELNASSNALQGILGALPPAVVQYVLAAFDTSNIRHYWISTSVSFVDAPPPTGSYVTASLIVEGRVP